MDPDSVKCSSGVGAHSRLSVSSPGILLLHAVEDDKLPPVEIVSPAAPKHHVRRESCSSSFSPLVPLDSLREATTVADESDRYLCSDRGVVGFSPPPSSSSQSTVRRILRDDATPDGRSSKCAASSIPIEPSPPVFQYPLSPRPILSITSSLNSYHGDGNRNSLKRESSILFSTASLPALSDHESVTPPPTTHSSEPFVAKHVSCFSRIFPNLGLVFILSTIWLVILVYGEYAYPHSHSQFCNSYLPKESLLGRVVIVSNPHVAQLPLKPGLFDAFYNLRTRIDSFLSDFNMRRNYRILQEKCAPDAFVFSGTLIVASASESAAPDRPIGMIDEEAYIKLLKRWNWMFTKTEKSKFLFASSVDDLAFQRAFNEANEVERRLLYQRFVDYFGAINWKVDIGPYTLASIFSPALDLSSSAFSTSIDAIGHPITPLQLRSSINSQLFSETRAFLDRLEVEMHEKRKTLGSNFSPVVLLSPLTLTPEANTTCLEWSSTELERGQEMEQVKYTSASEDTTRALLDRFSPRLVVSRGVLPRCTLPFPSRGGLSQTILPSISKRFSGGRPGVLVLEARNATLIASSGASSLLSTFPQNVLYSSMQHDAKSQANANRNASGKGSASAKAAVLPHASMSQSKSEAQRPDAYELVPIFFDVTTYLDMKGPYLWLAFMSILGCMLSVETSGSPAIASTLHVSDHFHQQQQHPFVTSTLIETLIAFSKFFAVSIILLARTTISYACAKTPLKAYIPPMMDLENGIRKSSSSLSSSSSSLPPLSPISPLSSFSSLSSLSSASSVPSTSASSSSGSSAPPASSPSRLIRHIALKVHITIEILLICCVIVVPWCIFVMFHWM